MSVRIIGNEQEIEWAKEARGINVTIVPTWTAVMKRRKRSQSSVERFGLAAGSI